MGFLDNEDIDSGYTARWCGSTFAWSFVWTGHRRTFESSFGSNTSLLSLAGQSLPLFCCCWCKEYELPCFMWIRCFSEHFPQICLHVAEKRQLVWMWELLEPKGYAEEFKLWKAQLLWDDIKGCISVISCFSNSIIVKLCKKLVYLYLCVHRCTYSNPAGKLSYSYAARGSGIFFSL